MALTIAKKAQNLTRLQRKAVAELAYLSPVKWVQGDYMDGTTRRSLSSLIVWGLVEGKQIKSARRTDYRLTDAGRATLATA